MPDETHPFSFDLDEHTVLRRIVEGTATATGEQFFAALVQNLAEVLQTKGAWVTEYRAEYQRLRVLAFRWGDEWLPDYEYDIADTPCQIVVTERRCVHVPQDVVRLYPEPTPCPSLIFARRIARSRDASREISRLTKSRTSGMWPCRSELSLSARNAPWHALCFPRECPARMERTEKT
jgi:hypothetical protein